MRVLALRGMVLLSSCAAFTHRAELWPVELDGPHVRYPRLVGQACGSDAEANAGRALARRTWASGFIDALVTRTGSCVTVSAVPVTVGCGVLPATVTGTEGRRSLVLPEGASCPPAVALDAPPPAPAGAEAPDPDDEPDAQASALPEDAEPPLPAESNPTIILPDSLLGRPYEGTVLVRYRVDASGQVHDVHGVRGDPGFLDEVVATVKRWRFRPASLDGNPIEVVRQQRVVLRVKLSGDSRVGTPSFAQSHSSSPNR